MASCCKKYTLRGKMAICRDTIAISLRTMTISLCIMAICRGKVAISPRTIAILQGKVTISLCKVTISLRIMAISLHIMVTLSRKMAIVCVILYVLDFKVYSSALFLGFKIAKHQSEKELAAIV